ncbi:MAG: S1 RNA-binding domain-containing protein [Anaerolineales bacterium]|nr:S1 RNA-binding domain-containing protein [Anaerolineales bacterium]
MNDRKWQLNAYHPESTPKLDEGWWESLLNEIEDTSEKNDFFESEGVQPTDEFVSKVDWDTVQRLFEADETIQVRITNYNQGGLLAENDVLQGFVPVSHLVSLQEPETYNTPALYLDALNAYVGRWLTLKVIECNPSRGRIVLSERAAQAAPGCRNKLFTGLQSGDRVSGTVTNVTEFGAFVDLGGAEGLIHVSELSWGRVQHPSMVLKIGQTVTAHVVQVDPTRNRIALSLKRLCANPWETVQERYQVGQVIHVCITTIVPYGAFARVEGGIDGLIHVSEMCLKGRQITPWHVIQEGQNIKARIVLIDAARQRLGLSLNLDGLEQIE